jgi:predicted LPLAT superfamily acyltransferase
MGRMADLEGSDVSGVMVKLLADILYKRASRADERWDTLAPVSLEGMDCEMAQEPVISAIILQCPVVDFCHSTRYGGDEDLRKAGV